MEYLYETCSGLLVFFSFSLLTKRKKSLSELIFSSWILLLLITVISFIFYAKGLSGRYPVFITLICDTHLLHGAFLYLYVSAFMNADFRLKKRHLWHLAPMLFQTVAKLYLNYVAGVMECYQEGGCVEEDNIYVSLTSLYKYLVLGGYIFFTWKQVLEFKNNAITPRDQMRYQWIYQIILGVSFLYAGVLLLNVGRYLWPSFFWDRMLLGNILTTLFIFIFLYIGNSYAYIFVSPSKNRFKNLSEAFNPANCQIRPQPDQMADVLRLLDELMMNEKPYTKGQITIKELSEITGIPSATISQTINTLTGKSVTDYINQYRVNLLKEKMTDPKNQHLKIMVLAEECGFNSQATLGRIFKQFTGMTPSQFQKEKKPDSHSI